MTRFARLAGTTALATFLSTEAWAQTAPVQNEPVFDEIVVTGQKIERTLQDTKESVAVLNAQLLDDFVLLDIEDVLASTANAFSFNGDEGFGLRGITNNSVGTQGGGGELATLYIDGVAYTGDASRLGPRDLWDVEQVEILRGPQSTNVGRNALAGAIVIRTANPELGRTTGAVRAQVATDDTYALEGMLNVPLGEDVAFRVSGEYFETDGFVDNVVIGGEDDSREDILLRAKLLWEPTDTFSAVLTGQYSDAEQGNDFYRGDLTGEFSRESSSDIRALDEYEAVTATLDLNWDIDENWSLRSISSFLSGGQDRLFDQDLGPTGGLLGATSGEGDDRNFAEELRLTYVGDRLRGVFGVYYIDIQIDDVTQGNFVINPATAGVPAPLLPFYPANFDVAVDRSTELEQRNFALFGQLDLNVTDRLTATVGLRYDTEEQTTSGTVSNTLVNGTLPNPADFAAFGPLVVGGLTQVNAVLNSQLGQTVFAPAETDFDAWLPEFGLTYALTDNTNVAAFYKRGYRSGGVEIQTAGTQDFFEPEYLDNFEVALRHTSDDRRWVFNANAYYGIWSDQQVSVPVNGSIFLFDTENAGRSLIAGVEVETQFRPNDRTFLFASLGYADTQFDEFCLTGSQFAAQINAPACLSEGVAGIDLDGFDFAQSPDWSGSIGGRYDVTDAVYVSGNVSYRDSSFSQVENVARFENDSAVLLNLRAGYERDGFEVAVFGRNILDEDYSLSRGPAAVGGNATFIGLGNPAEYGILISKRFG